MGRLLKGSGRLVPAPILSAHEQAARIVAEAQAHADRLRTEIESLRSEGERRGYQAGFAKGREAGLASVTEIVASARADADELHARAKDAALVLARRMAEKVVGRSVELAPEVMADILGQALAASRARAGGVTLRVHPDDLAATEATQARWASKLSAAVEVRVIADPAVGRFGCLVETPVGRLDARLDTQLDALERALLRARTPAGPRH